MSANWTDERVALLKSLVNKGHSASEIAARIGGVSRNAVIGKIHRLGINNVGMNTAENLRRRARALAQKRDRGEPIGGQCVPKENRRNGGARKAKVGRAAAALARLRPDGEVPPEIKISTSGWVDSGEVSPTGKTLFDLERNECHWPCGDPRTPEFRYCGLKAVEGLSYCEGHARRAYRIAEAPAPPRPMVFSRGRVSFRGVANDATQRQPEKQEEEV